jgi:ankyrin repeat protein
MTDARTKRQAETTATNPEANLSPAAMLCLAVAHNLPGVVLGYLLKGGDPNARESSGFCAIHYAARENNVAMIDLLVKHGADLEARIRTPINTHVEGWTALHVAASNGNAEAVSRLAESGADLFAVAATGETPREVARDHQVRCMLLGLMKRRKPARPAHEREM